MVASGLIHQGEHANQALTEPMLDWKNRRAVQEGYIGSAEGTSDYDLPCDSVKGAVYYEAYDYHRRVAFVVLCQRDITGPGGAITRKFGSEQRQGLLQP